MVISASCDDSDFHVGAAYGVGEYWTVLSWLHWRWGALATLDVRLIDYGVSILI